MATNNNVSLTTVRRANHKLISLLEKSATQEPKTGGREWVTGDKRNMDTVITFKTDGRNKGSLERFSEANGLGKKVYDALRNAVAYGAHGQGDRGLLTFAVTPRSLAALEDKLNAIYDNRDVDGNRKLDTEEQAQVKKTKNGKSTLAALKALSETKTTGLRTELKFSKQVNLVIDLLYSNGNIRGPEHVEAIARELSAPQAKAVRQAYAAVSRYMSRGATDEMGFICMDQRREVQRGLMRVFGAGLDETEKAISALRLPRAYA